MHKNRMRKNLLFRAFVIFLIAIINFSCASQSVSKKIPGSDCKIYHFSNGQRLVLSTDQVLYLDVLESHMRRKLYNVALKVPLTLEKSISKIYISPVNNYSNINYCFIGGNRKQICNFVYDNKKAIVTYNKITPDIDVNAEREKIIRFLSKDVFYCENDAKTK